MSRKPSPSPQSSDLPRRSLLKALAAAPAAVAASTGKANSLPRMNASDDPRLVEWEVLAVDFHRALENEINSTAVGDEEELLRDSVRAADAAIDAFVSRLDPTSPVDLGIRAKVAEWRYARRDDDLAQESWIYELIRANLEVAGIAPLEYSPFRVGYDDPRIKTQPDAPNAEPPPEYQPDSVTAGEDIANMRRLSSAYLETIENENLSDEDRAAACRELFAFGEEIRAKIGRAYSQRDDFVVLGNLVLAIDDIYLLELDEQDEFWGERVTASIDGNRNAALRSIIEFARKDGDKLVAEAARWNAEHGGANV